MATEFDARIKFKRDTSSNWTSNNPILLNGEIILVDTDSGELRAKVGDGVKSYTQLPFSDEVIRNLITEHNVSETAHENMGWITSDDGLPSEPALINADTLGGIAADEYATISNIPTDLSELNQDSTHRLVTDSEKQTWNNKSDFDGNYNNLTNKPSIPTVPKTVRAYIRVVDFNGTYATGLNNDYGLDGTTWVVEFELRENGDLYLPYDVTLCLYQPGMDQNLRWMTMEFPEDDPHVFSGATGSNMFANVIIWSSSGSYNAVLENHQRVYPSSLQMDFLNYPIGHRITMVRGWWGRLADV